MLVNLYVTDTTNRPAINSMLVIRFCPSRFPSVHKPLHVTVGADLHVHGNVRLRLLVHIGAELHILGAVRLLKHVTAALHVLAAVRLLVHVGDVDIIWGLGGLDIGVLDFFPVSPHVIIFHVTEIK